MSSDEQFGDGARMAAHSEYFEIDSKRVGARFGIWVTLPPKYGQTSGRYPVLYLTDGNVGGRTANAIAYGVMGDLMRPVHPYLQVAVGYLAHEADRAIVTRNRDLVPPGEGYSPEFYRYMESRVQEGLLTESDLEAFFHQWEDGRADRYLAFLEDELHDEVSRRYRVLDDEKGLFGISAGGLFSLYAFSVGSSFQKIGASSPGIVVEESRIYELYRELFARDGEGSSTTHLFVAQNDNEITGPTQLYRFMGMRFLRFIELVRSYPLPGLRLTTQITNGENHYSGFTDAYRGFIRKCYARPASEVPMDFAGSMKYGNPS